MMHRTIVGRPQRHTTHVIWQFYRDTHKTNAEQTVVQDAKVRRKCEPYSLEKRILANMLAIDAKKAA